eukprot:CAMPEP_0197539794 /NCGR_PEP_ID=MMETSP1318-20131121/63813_1 /TAXON_ID=552666 /ORGANISM="Partenskyella glossopodia, Strain RCC365" /LENGTH=331 /DNA_ID=CAMNT_0043098601 /DNA_START=42 /DNA_END=1034 /DNA_ORIENTATION=+
MKKRKEASLAGSGVKRVRGLDENDDDQKLSVPCDTPLSKLDRLRLLKIYMDKPYDKYYIDDHGRQVLEFKKSTEGIAVSEKLKKIQHTIKMRRDDMEHAKSKLAEIQNTFYDDDGGDPEEHSAEIARLMSIIREHNKFLKNVESEEYKSVVKHKKKRVRFIVQCIEEDLEECEKEMGLAQMKHESSRPMKIFSFNPFLTSHSGIVWQSKNRFVARFRPDKRRPVFRAYSSEMIEPGRHEATISIAGISLEKLSGDTECISVGAGNLQIDTHSFNYKDHVYFSLKYNPLSKMFELTHSLDYYRAKVNLPATIVANSTLKAIITVDTRSGYVW